MVRYVNRMYTVVWRKRAHYGFSAHPPVQPRFPFKIYNDYLYSAGIENREFPLYEKLEDVVRLVYTHYKTNLVANTCIYIYIPASGLH